MQKSESIKELATALSIAQGQIQNAHKDSANPYFNSSYADLASIRDATKEPFAANGLAVMQLPSADGAKVTVTTLVTHKSGEWVASDLTMTAKDQGPQAIGSIITYLRRYSLAAVAGVAPDDDDAEGAEGRSSAAGKKQPRAKPEPPKPSVQAEPKPAPSQNPWSEKFRSMHDALGPERYSQILGAFGCERTSDIRDAATAKRIIEEMNEAAATTTLA